MPYYDPTFRNRLFSGYILSMCVCVCVCSRGVHTEVLTERRMDRIKFKNIIRATSSMYYHHSISKNSLPSTRFLLRSDFILNRFTFVSCFEFCFRIVFFFLIWCCSPFYFPCIFRFRAFLRKRVCICVCEYYNSWIKWNAENGKKKAMWKYSKTPMKILNNNHIVSIKYVVINQAISLCFPLLPEHHYTNTTTIHTFNVYIPKIHSNSVAFPLLLPHYAASFAC